MLVLLSFKKSKCALDNSKINKQTNKCTAYLNTLSCTFLWYFECRFTICGIAKYIMNSFIFDQV